MVAVPELERRSISARRLALYSLALAAVLIGLAFVAYRELLHYERRALLHVPAGATLVVRVDLEQIVLFEPVRKHLLPLIDRVSLADGSSAMQDAHSGRALRLREGAGLNLGLDLRELVFARLGGGEGWVLAAGGLFPDRDLLESVARVLEAEPGARPRRSGSMLLLGAGSLALARASDGILLLGSSPGAVERALRPVETNGALGEGAAAFSAELPGPGDGASSRERVRGRLDYGDPFPLTLEVEHAAGDPDPARRALERWLHVDTTSLVAGADWGGERALLARATFVPASPTLTRVTTTWEQGEVDRACRSLASWLEAAAARLGPVAQ
jgi:hypothetical protein